MQKRDVVVIGASAGGIAALKRLVTSLPSNLPAAVLVVLHVGAFKSTLPQLLAAAGPCTVAHAEDGDELKAGHILVAPPDHHLLIGAGRARLSHGPKEHFARPSVDVLFRSAAWELGPRVIGVILTGKLDDGTAGLQAIKHCGGLALVQDPDTAEAAGMPASARDYVQVDQVLSIEDIGSTIARLVGTQAPSATGQPPGLRKESGPALAKANVLDELCEIAIPSAVACPECGGGLWEIAHSSPPRFRCHTGHVFSLQSLAYGVKSSTEGSLRAAIRAAQEQALVLRRLALESQRLHKTEDAISAFAQAESIDTQAEHLRLIIEQTPR